MGATDPVGVARDELAGPGPRDEATDGAEYGMLVTRDGGGRRRIGGLADRPAISSPEHSIVTRGMRVLILMSDTGGGHRSISLALQKALLRLAPERVEPRIVDMFALEQPTFFDRGTRLYSPVIRHAPWLYGLVFHLANHPLVYRAILVQAAESLLPKVRRLLITHQPEIIVSTHSLCNWFVLRALDQLELDVPVLATVTELVTVHQTWVEPGIAHYTTATAAAREAVLCQGASPRRVSCPGLPIHERFGRVTEAPAEIRRELGLAPDRFTLLVVGGSEGAGSLDKLIAAIDETGVDAQLIVVCGRNERLREKLQSTPLTLQAKILGFVRNIPELMQAADVVVTKGGPQSIVEALASGRPIIVTRSLPGQEEGNAAFVEAHGVGFDGRHLPRALWAIQRLAADPVERQVLAARARSLARPEAAIDTARTVLALATRSPAYEAAR